MEDALVLRGGDAAVGVDAAGVGPGRMLLKPVEVSITPLPFRSTHWPFSTRPMWTTLLPARLVAQTLPF